MTTSRKCYGQRCPMANALDVVGERWTMLILRELLGGPARFQDLAQGLPGIPRNLLTTRLRRLEEDGVVRRISAKSTTMYGLTELGAGIRPVLEALGFWGARVPRVGPIEHERSVRAFAMALHALLARAGEALPAEPFTVELEIAGEPVEVVLGPQPSVAVRPCVDVRARIRVSDDTMSAFLSSRAVDEASFALVSGDREARQGLLRALGVSPA